MNMHPNVLDRNETALVVVDVQESCANVVCEKDRVVTNVIKLVEAAKMLNIPVVTMVHRREKLGGIVPELAEVLPDPVGINKTTFSCCGAKPFVDKLEELGRRTVLLCGIETHVCLDQTAHDLLALGYKVQLAADAVSSRKESDHILGMEKMRDSGVVITSTEMAILELLRDTVDPKFKPVFALVK